MLLLAVYLRLVLRGWRGDPCGFKSHQPHHIEIIEAGCVPCFEDAKSTVDFIYSAFLYDVLFSFFN
ncbi:hypothetical protein SDC9_92090 [bioreactor metagenome]|uniref:Uncharacterized protein n=1 Tax=bioreactor metagenome TaxID=1076179 RepID=A0A645A3H3_9ZZZZ